MKPKPLDLDAPHYETIYAALNNGGTIIAVFEDRDQCTAYARRHGLRMAKMVKEIQ